MKVPRSKDDPGKVGTGTLPKRFIAFKQGSLRVLKMLMNVYRPNLEH